MLKRLTTATKVVDAAHKLIYTSVAFGALVAALWKRIPKQKK